MNDFSDQEFLQRQRLHHESPWPILLKFIAGLLLGTGASAVIWIADWKAVEKSDFSLVYIVVGIKFLVGIAFHFVDNWRSFGVGVMTSIALGA